MFGFLRKRRGKVVLGVVAALLITITVFVAHDLLEEEPPGIPHATEGRADCLKCHARPAGKPPVPEDHAGRTNLSCRGSHQPSR